MTDEPTITLQDITAAVQIIDLASSRGAIRGEEMSAVGQVRTNLAEFVEHSAKQQADGDAQSEDADANVADSDSE